jgi:plastocyanin
LGVALVVPASASAVSQRVAISNYQWSKPAINIDLGEHVTWYWVGPDLMHSVTGTSVNAAADDSDKGISQPQHHVGDTYSLTFTTPGTYTFQCKLHTSVRGTIVVSTLPGDPNADPDPVPESTVDLEPPYLSDLRLASSDVPAAGTRLRFALDSPGRIDAELWRLGRDGHRHYAGYQTWRGHVGYNAVHFATRSPGLRLRKRLRPGRYVADVTARDDAENVGRAQRLRFSVQG